MGYCLLYESMFQTVCIARDKWLKPGGMMLPDKYSMYIAGINDETGLKQGKAFWWKNVFGVDMSCLGQNFYVEPLVDLCPPKYITTDVCLFKTFDLNTCKKEDASFANQYQLKMQKDGKIDSMLVWFDTGFDYGLKNKVEFSTGPYSGEEKQTHWKQTMF